MPRYMIGAAGVLAAAAATLVILHALPASPKASSGPAGVTPSGDNSGIEVSSSPQGAVAQTSGAVHVSCPFYILASNLPSLQGMITIRAAGGVGGDLATAPYEGLSDGAGRYHFVAGPFSAGPGQLTVFVSATTGTDARRQDFQVDSCAGASGGAGSAPSPPTAAPQGQPTAPAAPTSQSATVQPMATATIGST